MKKIMSVILSLILVVNLNCVWISAQKANAKESSSDAVISLDSYSGIRNSDDIVFMDIDKVNKKVEEVNENTERITETYVYRASINPDVKDLVSLLSEDTGSSQEKRKDSSCSVQGH